VNYFYVLLEQKMCSSKRERIVSEGEYGPKIHNVLRISKRIEVGVREENIDPFGFNAVEDNKTAKRMMLQLYSQRPLINYFSKADVM
jgi:hypothetical protein